MAQDGAFPTAARILATLELLSEAGEPLRLVDVAASLKLPISSTHVLLRELVKREYAELGSNRRYAAGPRFTQLCLRYSHRLPLAEVSRGYISALARRIGEGVYLGAVARERVYYIDRVEGAPGPRVTVDLGLQRPLHATALGKLYLASLSDEKLVKVLATLKMEAYTAHTITDRLALRQELDEVRKQGCAVSREESIEGVGALAVPIWNGVGSFVGAVCVSVPIGRFFPRKSELRREVTATAGQISRRLGWQGARELGQEPVTGETRRRR